MKEALSLPALRGNSELDKYYELKADQEVFFVVNEKLECLVVEDEGVFEKQWREYKKTLKK
jgi:hypothetical protein